MTLPRNVKIVDLMMAIPVSETNQEWYRQFAPLLMDAESREQFKMPAEYLFKDVPASLRTRITCAFWSNRWISTESTWRWSAISEGSRRPPRLA
jgi:hypothetical protein